MKTFVLTPLAAGDLEAIWEFLAEENPEAADPVLSALRKAIRKLGARPGLGHIREDLADRRHRFFLLYPYLIVYRAETKPLQVLRVLHAARDVEALLGLTVEES